MGIRLVARQRFAVPIAEVFALCTDAQRFPAVFPGYGPIPAIRRIVLDGPLAVGSRRQIHNSDGSILDETIHVLQPPLRHAYRLSGFRAPFAWLVRQGEADWQLQTDGDGCSVEWSYLFEPVSALARPFAGLLLRGFMQPAMQRCLGCMQQALAATR